MSRTDRFRNGLQLVALTDRRLCPAGELLGRVELALNHGATAILLREKDLPAGEMLELARAIRQLTVQHDALLLIADRLDVALASDADGAHLGRAGIPIAAARRVVDDKLFLTASAHSIEELNLAICESADAVFASPVYPPQSKATHLQPLGLDGLQRFCDGRVPVVALGGITAERVDECIAAGAAGAAAIGMFFGARDDQTSEE